MKLFTSLILTSTLLIGGQALAANAPAPKEAAGCLTCHDVTANKIGPSYRDVAAKYAGKKDAQAMLAERIIKGTAPGQGWQKAGKASMPMMPPNIAIKPEDANKLAKWVLSIN
jgi:cytochrome c